MAFLLTMLVAWITIALPTQILGNVCVLRNPRIHYYLKAENNHQRHYPVRIGQHSFQNDLSLRFVLREVQI